MYPAKVVMHEVQRHRVAVVLKFLTEAICQTREAPHPHSHGKGFSGWDVRMKLGEIVGQTEDGRAQVKNLGTTVMSPAHAKAVLEALQKTVRLYEEKFGAIDLARIQTGGTPTP